MICDLAETYHIFDYRGLSPDLVATLVLGLRNDSRVKMKLSDSRINIDQALMARMVDKLNFLAWTYTKDARKGKPYKEKSVLKALNGDYDNDNDNLQAFGSQEEFEAYMKQFER